MHDLEFSHYRPSVRSAPPQLVEPSPRDYLPSESKEKLAPVTRFQTIDEVMQELLDNPPKMGESRVINLDPKEKAQLLSRLDVFARGKGFNWGITNGGSGGPENPVIIRFITRDTHERAKRISTLENLLQEIPNLAKSWADGETRRFKLVNKVTAQEVAELEDKLDDKLEELNLIVHCELEVEWFGLRHVVATTLQHEDQSKRSGHFLNDTDDDLEEDKNDGSELPPKTPADPAEESHQREIESIGHWLTWAEMSKQRRHAANQQPNSE